MANNNDLKPFMIDLSFESEIHKRKFEYLKRLIQDEFRTDYLEGKVVNK